MHSTKDPIQVNTDTLGQMKSPCNTNHGPSRNRIYTFPSFASDDGSEAHETLPSVSFLLFKGTLTKFPGIPLLSRSPDDFFPTEILCLLDLFWSSMVPFAVTFFEDI